MITFEMIYNKIVEVEKKVDSFLNSANDFELESVSVGKAAELLHVGDDRIKKLLKNKTLKSFSVDGATRIKLSEIKQFQNSDEHNRVFLTDNCETAEEIAKRIFSNKERKAS